MKKGYTVLILIVCILSLGLVCIGCENDVENDDIDDRFTFYDKDNNKLHFRVGRSTNDTEKKSYWYTGFDFSKDFLKINDFFSGTLNKNTVYKVNITGSLDKDLDRVYIELCWRKGPASYEGLTIRETINGILANTVKISSGSINETFELKPLMLNNEVFDQTKAFIVFYNDVEVPDNIDLQTRMATISNFSMTIIEKDK